MDQIKPLFTAAATAIGGRNGHTETSDGLVKADLSVPKAIGGPGKPGTATPEHLYALALAAHSNSSPNSRRRPRPRRRSPAPCRLGRATAAASVSP